MLEGESPNHQEATHEARERAAYLEYSEINLKLD